MLYGNPAPDNGIRGFVLTWACLRSRRPSVPLLWHAAGNALALASQIAAYEVFLTCGSRK